MIIMARREELVVALCGGGGERQYSYPKAFSNRPPPAPGDLSITTIKTQHSQKPLSPTI
jgi:hypothetical protein